MDKKPRKRKKAEHDFAINAFRIMQEATSEGQPEKDSLPAAKRGKARAAKLTPEQRKAIAVKAAKARWQAGR